MKLLYTKRSPYARKVRILALEKGIQLDLIDEDLVKKSQRLLEANPLGKVPTLILDDGSTLFDSPVIGQYLDSLNDKAIMIPRQGKGRFEVLKWEAFADDLTAAAIGWYWEKARHSKDFHQEYINSQERNIHVAYDYITRNIHQLKEFNLASIAVASAIGYIHLRLPHLMVQGQLASWFDEISKRPSIIETIPVLG